MLKLRALYALLFTKSFYLVIKSKRTMQGITVGDARSIEQDCKTLCENALTEEANVEFVRSVLNN